MEVYTNRSLLANNIDFIFEPMFEQNLLEKIQKNISNNFIELFYQNIHLYIAYHEACRFIDDPNLRDIMVGKNGGSLYIYCLWRSIPNNTPKSNFLKFLYPTLNQSQVKIIVEPEDLDLTNLFYRNDLISWVAFGYIDDNPVPGILVATIHPYITPYGQKKIPKQYKGYHVYQFEMPYQTYESKKVVKMGENISPADITRGYGTLGGFIEDNKNIYLLSNYHVLRSSDESTEKRILQPSYRKLTVSERKHLDKHIIADFVPGMSFRGTYNFTLDGKNYPIGLDVGVAMVRPGNWIISRELTEPDYNDKYVNPPNGIIRQPQVDDVVYKCGANSGLTRGKISGEKINIRDVPVYRFYSTIDKKLAQNPIESIILPNQIIIASFEGFAQPGDSGAIVFDEDGNCVGLLHGGTGTHALATDMRLVMNFLKQKMVNPILL